MRDQCQVVRQDIETIIPTIQYIAKLITLLGRDQTHIMKLIRPLTKGRHFRHDPIIRKGNNMQQVSPLPFLKMLNKQIILYY